MKLLLDILQGAGLALRPGVRPVPADPAAGGARVADLGIDFEGTDFAFLEAPVVPARRGDRAHGRDAAACARGSRRRPASAALQRHRHRPRRRCCSRARSTTAHEVWWPGLIGGVAVRGARAARRSATCSPAPAAAGPRGGRGAAALRRAASPWCSPALSSSSRRVSVLGDRLLRLAAGRRPPARGREVRRPAHPPLSAGDAQAAQARPRGRRRAQAVDARARGRRPAARPRSRPSWSAGPTSTRAARRSRR